MFSKSQASSSHAYPAPDQVSRPAGTKFDDLYPFKRNYYDLGGLDYHYVDEGQGDPVVMVHGNPTWSFYYRKLAKALRNDYRVIVPDHIGCGFSAKPSDDDYQYVLKQRVDDLEELLDAIGVTENITLVVHDWGGMIGMGYATRHPRRIKKIVVLNTAAFHLPATKMMPPALWFVRNTWLASFSVRAFNTFSRVASKVCVKRKPMSPEVLKAYEMPYDTWGHRIATLRFVQDIPLRHSDESYAEVSRIQESLSMFKDTPIQIHWGAKDFVFDDHFLVQWRKHFPKADVHYYEDCGHYILEDAAEEIIPSIQTFIQASDA